MLAAGVLKIARPAVWWASSQGMGVPCRIAAAVPWTEIVVGALLVAQLGRSMVAWVAVGLLVAFSALLAVTLARGQRPPCACFGSATQRISWWDLGRNATLIALGLVAALA